MLSFPPEMYDEIKRIAKTNHYMSEQEFIREAVRESLATKVNTSTDRKTVYHHGKAVNTTKLP